MPDPGLYPRTAPRPTDSVAERRLYDALKTALPAGWYAWHSLRIRTRDGWMGEGDFVLAAPRAGLIVLEVKGGPVEVRDGRWFQNGSPMERAPLEQAHRFRRLLLERLEEANCRPPASGVMVCLSDTAFDQPPTQDDVRDVILGEQDIKWLRDALPARLEKALPPARRPSGNWIARLHEMWGETWMPRLALGHRVRLEAERRVKLEQEQLDVLDQLDANDRMLVEGPAGSGKTLVAREAAIRFAQAGRRVLLLTFTEALALWLRRSIDVAGVEVGPIRRVSLALLAESGAAPEPPAGSPEWEDMSLRATYAPGIEGRYDAVVVDEAQDLNESDWLLVEHLVGRGRLWAFHDPAQRYWLDRQIPIERLHLAQFVLRRPQRCHPAIQALADRYAGKPADEAVIRAGAVDGTIGIVTSAGPADVIHRIGETIDKLCADGLEPRDIAVLSLRGRAVEDSIVHRSQIGRHPVAAADDPAMEDRVVCDTFLRFKGLERPAVIVTDLSGIDQRQRGVRMYIALTRALDVVRMVGTPHVIASDPDLTDVVW